MAVILKIFHQGETYRVHSASSEFQQIQEAIQKVAGSSSSVRTLLEYPQGSERVLLSEEVWNAVWRTMPTQSSQLLVRVHIEKTPHTAATLHLADTPPDESTIAQEQMCLDEPAAEDGNHGPPPSSPQQGAAVAATTTTAAAATTTTAAVATTTAAGAATTTTAAATEAVRALEANSLIWEHEAEAEAIRAVEEYIRNQPQQAPDAAQQMVAAQPSLDPLLAPLAAFQPPAGPLATQQANGGAGAAPFWTPFVPGARVPHYWQTPPSQNTSGAQRTLRREVGVMRFQSLDIQREGVHYIRGMITGSVRILDAEVILEDSMITGAVALHGCSRLVLIRSMITGSVDHTATSVVENQSMGMVTGPVRCTG